MSNNPYKVYYEASKSDDEWSEYRKSQARERIKELEEAASWNNESSVTINDEYQFSGGS